MNQAFETQERWNQFGRDPAEEIRLNPDKYRITACPHAHRQGYHGLLSSLGAVPGKQILELGCGSGEYAVYLAQEGAGVAGIDIGADLIAAARAVAELNDVSCQGSITSLPFANDRFDVAVGVAVLHHLQDSEVEQSLCECARVLNKDGYAVFLEPVENSRLFHFLQNLVPVGKGTARYRPSLLQRRAWAEYVRNKDERPLTSRELIAAGRVFRSVRLESFGCLIRLWRLFGEQTRGALMAFDAVLLSRFPPARYLAKTVLVEYRK